MKKVLFLIICLSCSLVCFAQFELIPGKLISKENLDKDFVVYEFKGINAHDLYSKTLAAITSLYVSADNVTNKVEDKMINIHGVQEGKICIKQLGIISCFDMSYNLVFRFKDEKLRIDVPIINDIVCINGYGNTIHMTIGNEGTRAMGAYMSIFKKDNSIKYKEAKENIESFFNNLVTNIVSEIESDNQSEDW